MTHESIVQIQIKWKVSLIHSLYCKIILYDNLTLFGEPLEMFLIITINSILQTLVNLIFFIHYS